jgi:phage recombination protein Bet
MSDGNSGNGRNQIALQAPRLPWDARIEETFGVDRASWKALVEAIFPAAKTTDAVCLALSYCKARGLDPFKKMVHIVPIWDSALGREVETVWPGIAEHRTTAFRTGQYAGADSAEFGPTIEERFEGSRRNVSYSCTVKYPEWCQITVYRFVRGQRVPIPGPRVYWTETFSGVAGLRVPNNRWEQAPYQMLEKCAEAAALRKAFPEEIGDQYTNDDVGALKDITPKSAPPTPPPPPRPTRAQPPEPPPEPPQTPPEPPKEPPPSPPPAARRRRSEPPPAPPESTSAATPEPEPESMPEPEPPAPEIPPETPTPETPAAEFVFLTPDGEVLEFVEWSEAVAVYADQLEAEAKKGLSALQAAGENGISLVDALERHGHAGIAQKLREDYARLLEPLRAKKQQPEPVSTPAASTAANGPDADPLYVRYRPNSKIQDWFPAARAKLKEMESRGAAPDEYTRYRTVNAVALERLADELEGWSRVLTKALQTAEGGAK